MRGECWEQWPAVYTNVRIPAAYTNVRIPVAYTNVRIPAAYTTVRILTFHPIAAVSRAGSHWQQAHDDPSPPPKHISKGWLTLGSQGLVRGTHFLSEFCMQVLAHINTQPLSIYTHVQTQLPSYWLLACKLDCLPVQSTVPTEKNDPPLSLRELSQQM